MNDIEHIVKKIQTYMEDPPLIVLGSGASIPYGLPSVKDLKEEIQKDEIIKNDPKFQILCDKLNKYGLEAGIDATELNADTLSRIRNIVWLTINEKDFNYLNEHNYEAPLEFRALLSKVIGTSKNKVVIVTTNYDRMAEYAGDAIGATVVTGFEGSLIRTLEISSESKKRYRTFMRERVVEIWKVHGSLDWFCSIDKGNNMCLPLSKNIPNGFEPLIIPPGKQKYATTHTDPYRTMITQSDSAFISAKSYLCIGYGFNDEHIQPKLLDQVKRGKPIVVLARTATESCKKHLMMQYVPKYIIFERSGENKTRVSMNQDSYEIDGNYWELKNFLEIW